MMRISKDQADKCYCRDADQYTVLYREREVQNWITADVFRRVVILANGTVLNGDVSIRKNVTEIQTAIPADVGFVGAGLVSDEPVDQPIIGEERPGDPDVVVEVTSSDRLPESDSQE